MPSITASKPFRSMTIDKARRVRFDWSSCNRFEETYGKSIPEAMAVNIGTRLITHLAWAGMLADEPSLTVRETERRLQAYVNNDGNINDLAQELILALVESGVLGKAKTEDDKQESTEGNETAVSE